MLIYLIRTEMATGNAQTMGFVRSLGLTSSPDRKTIRDNLILYPNVKNHRYTYHLLVRFGDTNTSGLKFHGAKIIYE